MKFRNTTFILLVLATFTFACTQSTPDGSSNNAADQTQSAKPAPTLKKAAEQPKTIQSQAGAPDEYGRLPGDPHYGHNHPPADQQQQPTITTKSGQTIQAGQAGQTGELDKYGRKPGDPHYGHNHE